MSGGLAPGWFSRELQRAERMVASWPEWKQDAMRREAQPRHEPDPCPCPSKCDEAQTCVGLCAFQPHRISKPTATSSGEVG